MTLQTLEHHWAEQQIKWGLWEWRLIINNRAKRRLGQCHHGRKTIEVVRFHMENDSDESVLDTLLHEIAHALAGFKAGHGPEWKRVAVLVGAQPVRCGVATVQQKGRYVLRCDCPTPHYRYRASRRMAVVTCKCLVCGKDGLTWERS